MFVGVYVVPNTRGADVLLEEIFLHPTRVACRSMLGVNDQIDCSCLMIIRSRFGEYMYNKQVRPYNK